MVLVAGVALLVFVIVMINGEENEVSWLRHHGVRADAVVIKPNDTSDFLHVTTKQITVRLRFRGIARTTVIDVDHPAPRFREEQEITVYVDPTNPTHLAVAGTENTSAARLFVTYLCFWLGIVLFPIGLTMLIRVARFSRVLRSGPWEPVPRTDLRFPGGEDALFRSHREPPTTFRMAWPRRTEKISGLSAWSCRAATGGRAVLAIRDGSVLFAFRVARTAKGRETLDHRFEAAEVRAW